MKHTFHFAASLAILGAALLTGACSQESVPQPAAATPRDPIADLVREFHDNVHDGTRPTSAGVRITGITTRTYHIPDSLLSATRADAIPDTYDIHTVSLDFGDTDGFAILSDTPGIDQVFYYTESGSIADTAYITPLKYFVEATPQIAANLLVNGRPQDTAATRANVTVKPLVRFEWGQYSPFNDYGLYCTCSKCSERGNHAPIGCVTVAVGQVIATHKKFTGTFYGTRDIDFDKLPNTANEFTSAQRLAIGHFMQEIALNCQVKFGCDGSGTSVAAAVNYLRDLGYKVDQREEALDKNRCLSCLQEGLPLLIAGNNGDVGHMWILDGVKYINNSFSYHMNWGWGRDSNGWATEYYYCDLPQYAFESYSKGLINVYFGSLE